MNPEDFQRSLIMKRLDDASEAMMSRDVQRAVDMYRDILRDCPGEPNASLALGIILGAEGNIKESATILQDSVAKFPDVADTQYNLGISAAGLGDMRWALQCYRRALELKPNFAEALLNIGTVYQALDQPENAIDAYRGAVECRPDFFQAWNNLAYCLLACGRKEEALDAVDRALEIEPNYVSGWNIRGIVLQNMNRLEDALEAYDRSIDLDPSDSLVLRNRGNCLDTLGRIEEALEAFAEAKTYAPQMPESYTDLAVCMQRLGRTKEAFKVLQEGENTCPSPEIEFRLGLAHMAKGDIAEGWRLYESRFAMKDFGEKYLAVNRWDGALPVRGNALVVRAEQGFGDTLQFARLLPFLKKTGVRVIFECQPGLKKVLAGIDGFDEIVERPTNNSPTPFAGTPQVPLMSLPYHLGLDIDRIPCAIPYLKADAGLVEKWGRRMEELSKGRSHRVKVGIAWAGRAEHKADRYRSATFDLFASLAGVKDVMFFGLQMGDAAQQAEEIPSGMAFVDIAKEIGDFTDTAAIVENLDLVISVDTSIVHLTGALGKPVWNLISNDPDARWMLGRADSPWYPTMRLFRQKSHMDWAPVLQAARKELAKFAKSPIDWQIDQAKANHASGKPGCRTASKTALLEVARRNPRDTNALNALGVLSWEDGDIETSVSALTRAVTVDPRDETSVANCADVMLAIGESKVAAKLCRDYLEVDPGAKEIGMILARAEGKPMAVAA